MSSSLGFKGMFNKTIESRTDNRDFDFWEEMVKRWKKEDILPRMESYFINEIGKMLWPIGSFRNIVDRALGYHRKDFPPFILNEVILDFKTQDNHVNWEEFIGKLNLELDISQDFDEVMAWCYQWMKYNGMYSLHEVFKTTEIDKITFQEGCKKAGSELELSRIDRIFFKYSDEDKDEHLDFEKVNKLFEDRKSGFISRDRQVMFRL